MKGLKFPLYSYEVYSKKMGYWPPFNNLHYVMYSTHGFPPADAILSINFTIFGSCCCVQFDDLSELWKSCFFLQNLSWILFLFWITWQTVIGNVSPWIYYTLTWIHRACQWVTSIGQQGQEHDCSFFEDKLKT